MHRVLKVDPRESAGKKFLPEIGSLDLLKTLKPSCKKLGTDLPLRPVSPVKSVPFLQRNKLAYFTRILPLGSSVPCTRTRLPSNFATSV